MSYAGEIFVRDNKRKEENILGSKVDRVYVNNLCRACDNILKHKLNSDIMTVNIMSIP